jgi:hypothetical protein
MSKMFEMLVERFSKKTEVLGAAALVPTLEQEVWPMRAAET